LRKNWDFRSRFERARLQPLGKTAGVEKTFSAASGVATIRIMATRGGNGYQLLRRSKQQRGLSTPFGWRLTSLKMTDKQDYTKMTDK